MLKVIASDSINEVRRLCFGGALLPALFFESEFLFFEKKMSKIEKYQFLCTSELSILRVRRPETRLTV